MKPSASMPSQLKFNLFSGGSVHIDRQACLACTTKACVKNCVSSTLDPVLAIRNGIPELARTDIPTEKGWCIECMACELDCALYGKNVVKISWPS